jgi:hypothetical protein
LIALDTIGDIARQIFRPRAARRGRPPRAAHGEDPREVAVSLYIVHRTLSRDVHRRADNVLHLHRSADDIGRRCDGAATARSAFGSS